MGDDRTLLHRTLGELCRSDVPLSKAFAVLEKDLGDRRLRRAVRAMALEVEEGARFSDAYAQQTEVFPPGYRALVAAGTASGDVASALEAIAVHAERDADTRRRLKKALAAPLLTGVLVLLIGTLALVFAIPRLWAFAERVGGTSPAPYAFAALGVLVLLLLAMGAVAVRGRRRYGSLGFAWPVVGPIRREAARATVASSLALLLRRRLPLATALELVSGTTDHAPTDAALARAAEHARDGEDLVGALEATGLFDQGALWLIQGAEATGDAEGALDDAASLHRRRLDRKLDRFTLLVRPAAELVLGVVVFAFAFSYMLPLFEFTSRILGGGY